MSYPKEFFLVFSVVLACAFLAGSLLVGDWFSAWTLSVHPSHGSARDRLSAFPGAESPQAFHWLMESRL